MLRPQRKRIRGVTMSQRRKLYLPDDDTSKSSSADYAYNNASTDDDESEPLAVRINRLADQGVNRPAVKRANAVRATTVAPPVAPIVGVSPFERAFVEHEEYSMPPPSVPAPHVSPELSDDDVTIDELQQFRGYAHRTQSVAGPAPTIKRYRSVSPSDSEQSGESIVAAAQPVQLIERSQMGTCGTCERKLPVLSIATYPGVSIPPSQVDVDEPQQPTNRLLGVYGMTSQQRMLYLGPADEPEYALQDQVKITPELTLCVNGRWWEQHVERAIQSKDNLLYEAGMARHNLLMQTRMDIDAARQVISTFVITDDLPTGSPSDWKQGMVMAYALSDVCAETNYFLPFGNDVRYYIDAYVGAHAVYKTLRRSCVEQYVEKILPLVDKLVPHITRRDIAPLVVPAVNVLFGGGVDDVRLHWAAICVLAVVARSNIIATYRRLVWIRNDRTYARSYSPLEGKARKVESNWASRQKQPIIAGDVRPNSCVDISSVMTLRIGGQGPNIEHWERDELTKRGVIGADAGDITEQMRQITQEALRFVGNEAVTARDRNPVVQLTVYILRRCVLVCVEIARQKRVDNHDVREVCDVWGINV